MNFIDTADAYGPNVSEELIARDSVPLSEGPCRSHQGRLGSLRTGRWEPNGRPKHLRQALEGSLKRLRLDQIDLYQFHRPDPDVPFEESVGALVNFRNEGKIATWACRTYRRPSLRPPRR